MLTSRRKTEGPHFRRCAARQILLLFVLMPTAVACRAPHTSTPSASPSPGENSRPLPSPLPDVAAYVNGQAIPIAMVRLAAQRAKTVTPEQQPDAYRQALEFLIEREILFQEALIRRIRPDDRIVERLYDQERTKYKDEREFRAALAAQGLTPARFRLEIMAQQTVRALMLQEEAKVPPSAVTMAEVQAYFATHAAEFQTGERLVLSQILVALGDDTTREAQRAKADAILARVRRGEDFSALAAQDSDDPASRLDKGRLPELVRGRMSKPFEDAAFALSPGTVSEVVETPQGFHIIKLHERLPSQSLSLEQVAEQLQVALLQSKRQQAFDALRATLKSKARIERYL
jgi:peptidyl-prolyl cis-trans isomerase C